MHVKHLSKAGLKLPSISEIPGIFAEDISGFEDWICKGLHGKEDKCCIQAKRNFYSESAKLGNDIHSLRQAFLNGETFEEGVPEYQAAIFEPIAQFYKASGYKPLVIEQDEYRVKGVELRMTGLEMGGTLDGCGTFSIPFWEKQRKTFWDRVSIDNADIPIEPKITDVWIDDLKIKSKLSRLHPLQLYGYSLLLKECYGVDAKWGLIIRREKKLDKRPELQLKGYYLPAFKAQWDASMLMWRFLND